MSSNVRPSRVMVVDDDAKTRQILARWLTHAGYAVSVAEDGVAAVSLLKVQPADVVITDLKMPLMNGLQLLSAIKELGPETEVIILTGQGTIDDAVEALRGGRAFDFLQKPVRDFNTINAVVQQALSKRASAAAQPERAENVQALHEITQREREILELVVAGLNNKEVAERLFLSEKTVKNNLTRIYEKLQVASRAQAIVLCQRAGWGAGR